MQLVVDIGVDKSHGWCYNIVVKDMPVCPPVSFGPGGFLMLRRNFIWRKRSLKLIDN